MSAVIRLNLCKWKIIHLYNIIIPQSGQNVSIYEVETMAMSKERVLFDASLQNNEICVFSVNQMKSQGCVAVIILSSYSITVSQFILGMTDQIIEIQMVPMVGLNQPQYVTASYSDIAITV
jgi:alpha-D-ribose 1-methylphosphonate 5-triphosphate synthase subunit PhnI